MGSEEEKECSRKKERMANSKVYRQKSMPSLGNHSQLRTVKQFKIVWQDMKLERRAGWG